MRARDWNKHMTVEERTVLLYDTPCTNTISHPPKTFGLRLATTRTSASRSKDRAPTLRPRTGAMQRTLEATSFDSEQQGCMERRFLWSLRDRDQSQLQSSSTHLRSGHL